MQDVQQKTPPAGVKVIGILQLIFGGLGLLLGLIGLLALVAGFKPGGGFGAAPANNPQAKMQQELQEGLEQAQANVPGGKAVQYGDLGANLLLSLMMIASGIGLLQLQPWGRSLAIGYAVLSLLTKVFGLIFALAFTIPAITEFMDSFAVKYPEMKAVATVSRIAFYGGVFGALVVAIYPIIVLFIMLSRSTRVAFGASPAVRPDLASEEDEPWGRS